MLTGCLLGTALFVALFLLGLMAGFISWWWVIALALLCFIAAIAVALFVGACVAAAEGTNSELDHLRYGPNPPSGTGSWRPRMRP